MSLCQRKRFIFVVITRDCLTNGRSRKKISLMLFLLLAENQKRLCCPCIICGFYFVDGKCVNFDFHYFRL